MDLWIRSQDKENLIKVGTRISIMDYGDEYVRQIFVGDFRIGEYATKERALEVLSDIQHKLISLSDSMNRQLYVYEMPKEMINNEYNK